MIWLVIAFLVSLGALLFAAAGLAHHIWLQHRKLRRMPSTGTDTAPDPALDPAEETDVEREP
jgi:hypothetical protein